ncbi:unnamed protein product [Cylindrotheca closterium]|uniref:Uncharacterized protein n=1 Tax=Cylindrotheca closterium TaxID=2856 RepID=A0AAD2FL47_9STRA|nr:unnamed protein product [Cylindrotheca closterium]
MSNDGFGDEEDGDLSLENADGGNGDNPTAENLAGYAPCCTQEYLLLALKPFRRGSKLQRVHVENKGTPAAGTPIQSVAIAPRMATPTPPAKQRTATASSNKKFKKSATNKKRPNTPPSDGQPLESATKKSIKQDYLKSFLSESKIQMDLEVSKTQKRHEETIVLKKEEISQNEKHFRLRFEEERKVFKRKAIEEEASFRKACLAELHELLSNKRSDRYIQKMHPHLIPFSQTVP